MIRDIFNAYGIGNAFIIEIEQRASVGRKGWSNETKRRTGGHSPTNIVFYWLDWHFEDAFSGGSLLVGGV